MEQLSFSNYLKEKPLVVSKGSSRLELAKEINRKLGLPFWRINQIIKVNGIQCARECLNESQKEGVKSPIGFFIHLIKQNSTKLEKTGKVVEVEDDRDFSYSTSRRILEGVGKTEQEIDSLLGRPYG